MLKRYQIFLEEWQIDYIKKIAEIHDQSFSEILRVILCEGIMGIVSALHPEYKLKLTQKEFANMIRSSADPKTPADEVHAHLSKIYFETRKALEYRMEALNKIQPKNPNKKRKR